MMASEMDQDGRVVDEGTATAVGRQGGRDGGAARFARASVSTRNLCFDEVL